MSELCLEGEATFPLPAALLGERLQDLGFLVGVLPDLESATLVTAEEARGTVRPGLAFLRGTLDVTLRRLPETTPQTVHLAVTSRGLAHASEARVHLHLSPAADGTCVRWTVEVVQLSGLLQTLPRGLLRGAANKVIQDILERLRQRLAASATPR
jgi:carbon monoxide dehydrogenase subunit G